MITLTIDNKPVQVPEGSTILEAAQQAGIHIPTLCYAKNLKPSTSCMVCVVRVEGTKHLVPACGTRIAEKMRVTTCDDQIQKARRAAVELLLSDHLGDCLGPCTVGCPAKMNIPLMLRQISAGDLTAAIQTIKKDIPLPAILGRICPAPCEKVCRRSQADSAVSICLLKRFVADMDLASDTPFMPQCQPRTGKKVAIVGAGPAGLSAVYYLQQAGIACSIYDDHDHPGGALRYADIDRTILPLEVLETEIERILSLDIEFRGNTRMGRDVSMDELKSQYDAMLLTVGSEWADAGIDWPVDSADGKMKVSHSGYTTSIPGIFAAGGCIGSRNLCIRAVADGKQAAFSIQSYLSGLDATAPRRYNHRMGLLENEELELFSKLAFAGGRMEPKSSHAGLTLPQAKSEAARCLHCDCRKADACQLRDRATELNARQRTWQGEKKRFQQITEHEQIIFEPGKCIKCGLCIQTAQTESEQIGLSFRGRGFDTKITVPLNKSFACGLTKAAKKCVQICPTGALAMKERNSPKGLNKR